MAKQITGRQGTEKTHNLMVCNEYDEGKKTGRTYLHKTCSANSQRCGSASSNTEAYETGEPVDCARCIKQAARRAAA